MSEKLKNGDEVKFSIPSQIGFYMVWVLLGIIGTAITIGLALAALVTYGRDTAFALMAGNLGNLVLNLIAFGVLGCGLSLLAGVVGILGLKMPWDYWTEGHAEAPMKELREFIVTRRYGQPDGEAS